MIKLPIKNSPTPIRQPKQTDCTGIELSAAHRRKRSVKVKGFTDEVPSEPLLFPKTPNVLIGPEQPIVIPRFLKTCGFNPCGPITRRNWP
jgi:2-keto-4-pentenoate hydratase/2-oxohepta-3-ene-1,7-dioic acid hydratase in catechol pathway